MSNKLRVVLVTVSLVMLLLVTGCAGGFLGLDVAEVDDTAVTVPMQYLQGPEEGPMYNVSLNVPSDWVGSFRIRNVGNVAYFEYTGDTAQPALVFTIDALSNEQYWAQSGSYPGSYQNIINQDDTYFIYHLPIDTYYSGLSESQLATLSAEVPAVIESFEVELVQ